GGRSGSLYSSWKSQTALSESVNSVPSATLVRPEAQNTTARDSLARRLTRDRGIEAKRRLAVSTRRRTIIPPEGRASEVMVMGRLRCHRQDRASGWSGCCMAAASRGGGEGPGGGRALGSGLSP